MYVRRWIAVTSASKQLIIIIIKQQTNSCRSHGIRIKLSSHVVLSIFTDAVHALRVR